MTYTGLGPLLTTLNYFLIVPEFVGKHPNLYSGKNELKLIPI
jgi:hypothetical protein